MILADLTEIRQAATEKTSDIAAEISSEKSRQRYHPPLRAVNAFSRGGKKKHKCPEFAEIPGMEIERGGGLPLWPTGDQKGKAFANRR